MKPKKSNGRKKKDPSVFRRKGQPRRPCQTRPEATSARQGLPKHPPENGELEVLHRALHPYHASSAKTLALLQSLERSVAAGLAQRLQRLQEEDRSRSPISATKRPLLPALLRLEGMILRELERRIEGHKEASSVESSKNRRIRCKTPRMSHRPSLNPTK